MTEKPIEKLTPKEELIRGIVVLSLFIVVVFPILYFTSGSYNKEIDENKVVSIGKFSYCGNSGKTYSAFIVYYIDNKKYKEACDVCPDNYEDMLKKFYVINYSSLDPEKVRVDFTKRVTDTVALRREGFSQNEIKRSLKPWVPDSQ
ncbi:hypothetical protein ACLI1A_06310 [Flavobacterium sp. RHBU_3]|uniref:hypothetical protein n=1 Tax=Flavobacterium sp. RHBU_3 TaxID=3391184 RepID=UPI003984EE5F